MHHSSQTRVARLKTLATLLLCSLLSVAFLHRYVFAVYIIEGSSMAPTLRAGDRAMVNMLVGRLGPIVRGQVVLIEDGYSEYATKRVIGLPGEKLEIKDNQVLINGQVLFEHYLPKHADTGSELRRFVLGPRQYFVMGDNRCDSLDSRDYGPIARESIIGSYSRVFWAWR